MNTLQVMNNLLDVNSWLVIVIGFLILTRFLLARFPLALSICELLCAPLVVVLIFAVLQVSLPDSFLRSHPEWFSTLFSLVFCLVTSWYAAKFGHAFLGGRYLGKQKDHPQPVPGLLRGLVTAACLFVGAAVFFRIQGYSLTGVWISTGLATAFIGFALQQTLGDLFSGIALSLEGAFRIGDRLRLENGTEGQVVDINWRATWLKDWDNTTHVIPNGRLAAQGFKNLYTKYHLYRPWYYVKIPAEIDPRFAKELLFEAISNCRHVLRTPSPVVRLTDASSVPYTYMVWVTFENYQAMFPGREELYREIHYVFKRAGVSPAAEIHEWRVRRAEIPVAEPPSIQIALKSLDLFSTLPDEKINQIAQASRQIFYDANSTILLEGDARDALDIVISGVIEYRVKLPNGKQALAGELEAGQYFGLISMVTDQPSFFEYTAQTDVTLIRVDVKCMREILKEYPGLSSHYAAIIKQRLDDAEMLRVADSRTTTIHEIKHFIKQLIKTGKK